VAAACSAQTKARRCASSAHWVNSSSNWSTTSTSRHCRDGLSRSALEPLVPGGRYGRASAACRAVSANPSGSAASPRRTAAASAPASGATRSASSSSGARVGVNTTHGHHAAPSAAASPPAAIRGNTPARSNDDFPAPDAPDTTSSPTPPSSHDIRSSTWPAAASRPKKNAASCSPNTASPRYGEPATAPGRGPALSAAARTRAGGTVPRAAATNSSAAGPVRPSAPASSTAVSLCAVRLMPRSKLLTDRGDTPAASASSSWVSFAPDRSCRSSPANDSAGSVIAVPPHNLSATATGTGRNQSCPNTTQAQPRPPLPGRARADLAQPSPQGVRILVGARVGGHAWRTPQPPATVKPATDPSPAELPSTPWP
jgi:hypothetical protein